MITRVIVPVLAALAVSLATTADARAEVRTGTKSDPAGDTDNTSTGDVLRVNAQYDTKGAAVLVVTFAGDLASGQESFLSFAFGKVLSDGGCRRRFPVGASTGPSGVGGPPLAQTTTAVSVSGPSITISISGPAIANLDISCVTGSVGQEGGTCTEFACDRVDVVDAPPLYFTGFDPDGEDDPYDLPASCERPKLKGKTLAAARRALKRASCELGRVTRNGRKRPNAKLVVVKVKGRDPINLTLAYRKR